MFQTANDIQYPFMLTNNQMFQILPFILRANACKAKRTTFNLSLVAESIKLPSLSNFAGDSKAFKKNSGLLMKWRSRYTPICRRWYWPRAPPKLPEALTIAAVLSAQTFGALDAQSIAFFKGPDIHNQILKIHK